MAMFAVTESLPVGLSTIVAPRGDPERVPACFLDATTYESVTWFPSGRTAIKWALLDAGVQPSEEVILPGYTCYAVDEAVDDVATPVYVDVGEDFTMDAKQVRKQVSENTAAIVPTHLYGIECDVSEIAAIAKENDLTVVEDAAQATGNIFVSERVGQAADYTAISVRYFKEATAYSGGLLLGAESDETADEERFKRERLLGIAAADRVLRAIPGRLYDPLRASVLDPIARSESDDVGEATPIHPSEWTRALLATQVSDLERRRAQRQRNAAIYDEALPTGLHRPPTQETVCLFRYPVLVPYGERDALCRRLRQQGVGCSTMYAYTVSPDGVCPTAERLAAEVLNLPIHASLDTDDVASIADTVTNCWSSV
jgi:dTDP-4-amino-4,6-dideoxygalactose transaminase